jgi:probable F420-dependent oxidoreductase
MDPVLDDLGTFLLSGRVKDPALAMSEAVEAERLGLRRIWISERYDLKEAGAMIGGVLARTSRILAGPGVIATGSRHPLLTAALGTTMQGMYGGRFVLGLGRSIGQYLREQGIPEASFAAYEDYVGILRRLWAGETVSYDGPVGSFEALRIIDLPTTPPPPIWCASIGGPRMSRLAGRIADGVLLSPCMTPEATAQCVRWIREEREHVGLDPAGIRVCQPLLSAPELDPTYTDEIIKRRIVGYVQFDRFRHRYAVDNGWDLATMERICNHPMFQAMDRGTIDQSFRREELATPAQLVPDSWVDGTCAVGSIAKCVAIMQDFRDAGADELALYASTPTDNARLIAAWREHTSSR